jgi:hypothetical protein
MDRGLEDANSVLASQKDRTMNKRLFRNFVACGLAAFALTNACQAQADDWEWTIAPYLWASGVELDLTINDNVEIGGDATFKNILDKVDTVLMGHFEGRKGRWGMYLDTIYLDLSDSARVSVGPGGPILRELAADTGMKMKLYDAGGLYRLAEPESHTQFDLLAGVRYVDVSVDALLTLPGPGMNMVDFRTGPSGTDLMLGARAIGKFAERWRWALRGDLSFGDTEGTYNGLASVGYTFGQSELFTLTAGYRFMNIEMKGRSQRGESMEADITMSGPIVGFIFNF